MNPSEHKLVEAPWTASCASGTGSTNPTLCANTCSERGGRLTAKQAPPLTAPEGPLGTRRVAGFLQQFLCSTPSSSSPVHSRAPAAAWIMQHSTTPSETHSVLALTVKAVQRSDTDSTTIGLCFTYAPISEATMSTQQVPLAMSVEGGG